MENSDRPLASESFSFSWLLDEKFPFDSLLNLPKSSLADSIEISRQEPKHMDMAVQSHRFFNEDQNFNFDIPVPKSSAVLAHAHEIFSDGRLKPVFLDRPIIQVSSSAPATPTISLFFPENMSSGIKSSPGNFLRKWRKSSIRILQKCRGFLLPICRRLTCSRESVRVDDLGRKGRQVQSWSNSLQASPRRSLTYSAINWGEIMQARGKLDMHNKNLHKVKSVSNSPRVSSPLRSTPSTDVIYGAECPIDEAILHCKRSIGK